MVRNHRRSNRRGKDQIMVHPFVCRFVLHLLNFLFLLKQRFDRILLNSYFPDPGSSLGLGIHNAFASDSLCLVIDRDDLILEIDI